MRILLVADVSITNIIGGAERVLYEHALFLTQQGHRVVILTRKLSIHTCNYQNIEGIHEYRYEIPSKNPLLFLLSTIINAQRLFKDLIKDHSFDIINFHQPFSAFSLNLLPEMKTIKRIYICHSLSFEEYISLYRKRKSLFFPLHVFLRRKLEQFSLRQMNKIIVLSEFTKNKIITTHGIHPDKIMIIPGGVNLERFKPAHDKHLLRKELDIPQGAWVLFTVRNLVPRMGLANLVNAISLLQQKGAHIHLFIAGKGPLKEELQRLISERHLEGTITLCGFLSDDNLLKYYQMADFFILPTIELEGFGLVTIEAMACGTPVLATPIGGTIEILRPFKNDHLFNDTSPQAMAELIFEKYTYYKDNQTQYEQLCQQSRTYIEQNYSSTKNSGRLEHFLTVSSLRKQGS